MWSIIVPFSNVSRSAAYYLARISHVQIRKVVVTVSDQYIIAAKIYPIHIRYSADIVRGEQVLFSSIGLAESTILSTTPVLGFLSSASTN